MTELAEPGPVRYPMKRTCPFEPPPEYRTLREAGPIVRAELPSGRNAWVLTRYDEVRAVLGDTRFSSDRFHPGFPLILKSGRTAKTRFKPSLISMDPPEHGPARRAVVGEFTVKRMTELRPRIQKTVDGLISAMLAGPKPADLVAELALPVPSLVICELLGVPYADHEFFQGRTRIVLTRDIGLDDRQQALEDLWNYLDELVAAKEADPGDDLIGRQVLHQRASGEVDHEALVALASLLLVAGHETVSNMISLGILALLEHPAQLAALKADPGKTPGAVDELLRYFTIAEVATSRAATADVEIAGTVIRAGEGVIALSHSANRDETSFAEPDVLDIERGARHHVAFGFGPHQCLGQNLARMELQIVFDTVFRRMPALRLAAEVESLPFKDDATVYGLHELPVTW
ncbi:cytochrome P450 [Amycolatopsis minnesotensis]|uniref:Cytochrome P450 n=1 Tax=Amycolatopsis minnesotensis TaxID=337894 RepID=A0ABN2RQN0_9PSEU